MAVAHRMYARALFEAARGRAGSTSRTSSSATSSQRSTTCPSSQRCSRTRSSTRGRRRACSSEILGGADELVRNFVLLVAEKGRAGELGEIAASSTRSSPPSRAG